MSLSVNAKLLEGKTLAAQMQNEIREFVVQAPGRICLAVIETKKDPSAEWYMGAQEKLAAKLGIEYLKTPCEEVPDEGSLIMKIREYSEDPFVHGIFLSMPLPTSYSSNRVIEAMDPKKDVEGIHPSTLGLIVMRRRVSVPPTAYSAYLLAKSTNIPLMGKRALVIGQSAIVGRPLAILLGEERMTTTIANAGTTPADLQKFVSESDFVFAAVGKPGLVKGEWVKPGAVVVDVGTTEVNGKLVGDVDFEEACKKAGFVTPVPGGVGPLTTTLLFKNLVNLIQSHSHKK
ncbi:MAG TPA: bifunctional 5,10-methylenetetrahydrofolate dehydrogenase/5,10-methenyltetrahydrofolate cyclohydrolase [Candidatus Omnitrophota bacterium]|nr:bifunctional 5,10-methylenetetrahydrofolate dehydrogenase/5,10-methenyltetrahydrofolate cyclohydrolase [Candidatus Omnitrophota bacterium]